jgi:hypothetical protein
MHTGYRQEVFNVLLAQLLQERGVIAAPENVIRSSQSANRRMPDVIVNFQGLRTVIEGEVNDQPNAHEKALASVGKRVEDGIAHIGVAVIYPGELRKVAFNTLKRSLADCDLEIAIVTESEKTDFIKGDVNYLENALRRAFEHLVQEDVVANAVAALEAGIERFASVLSVKAGDVGRVAESLGIRELENKPQGDSEV